jgi:EAL domain-containing protein (putative c-di-GMP-specific phosphodiesterase class I)
MSARIWPSIVVTAALCGSAVACAVYGFTVPQQASIALAAAVVSLAMAGVLMVGMVWGQEHRLREALQAISRERRAAEEKAAQTFVTTAAFDTAVADLQQRAARTEEELIEVQGDMRKQYFEMSSAYQSNVANRYAPAEPPEPVPEPAPAHDPATLLNFLLEPIIDLSASETAHYRAQVTMTAGNGADIPFERLMSNADKAGFRPSLDVHFVTQAVPLLRRLRLRHPAMRLFLPLGGATLRSEDSIARITDILRGASDVASGLVFELNHDVLGRLDDAGTKGLAAFARFGSTLALMQSSIVGLDLPTLRQLGVKYIGIDASSIESGYGVAPTWLEFAQVARGLQFQILLTGVVTAKQAASASQVARYVAGAYFAPPRRVKADAGAAPSRFSSAA